MEDVPTVGNKATIARDTLHALIEGLGERGYQVLGPTVRDDAIVYDDIAGLGDLPAGWSDRQEPGRYRLVRRDDDALFGYVVGLHSWKQFLHPPVEPLWTARKTDDGLTIEPADVPETKFAFFGMRSCEIEAMAIQDRVFQHGPYQDTAYAARRADVFVVAVNCAEPGGTCFCTSMNTGPKARAGFDIALTELVNEGSPDYLVEIGSAAGADILAALPHRPASEAELAAADRIVAKAQGSMGRTLDTDGLKELLQQNPHHPRWDDVGERCLSCANCTMVCPTCFCTTVEDHSDLAGETATRVKKWDSCFTMDFSYIHGGSVRKSGQSRYRQWMTHKLASWIDQFGTSGCVGCGRCISWCPVGIDITEEVAAIRQTVPRTGGEDLGND